MEQNHKTVTVFGGTGFVGRQVVRVLAKRGMVVKVATRIPERAYFLKTSGTPGQIVPVVCSYNDRKSIASAVQGSDYVVNCVGVLYERRKGQFKRVHTEVPGLIAEVCKNEKVERFVHVSACGIEEDRSHYAQTKLAGEKEIEKFFPRATILRPSVIFGPDDNFFNRFAGLARIAPILPLIGGGQTRFQPVYVGDVADAVAASLTAGDEVCGRVFELGGPEVLTFREIYERLFKYTHRRRKLMNLPWFVASVQACFLGMLPNPLLTRDQVISLKADHVVAKEALKLHDLGIHATALELVLPKYLETYRPGGRFAA